MSADTSLVFAIPNGGRRGKVEAGRLKAEGVLPGVPDLCLPVPIGGCAGLWVEFKQGRNRATPEQARIINELVALGHVVLVAYDWGEAWEWTVRYLRGELGPGMFVIGRSRSIRSTPAAT